MFEQKRLLPIFLNQSNCSKFKQSFQSTAELLIFSFDKLCLFQVDFLQGLPLYHPEPVCDTMTDPKVTTTCRLN